jgi:menaquinone-dependent protoporphyrinogen oxidase
MPSVLVAYADRQGSTHDAAVTIGQTLREHGCHVGSLHAGEVYDPLRGWNLVVVGGGLGSSGWHRIARRFVRRHGAELGRAPLAVFGVSPWHENAEERRDAVLRLRGAVQEQADLQPAAAAVFDEIEPAGNGWTHWLGRGDLRDWIAVRGWAKQLLTLIPQEQRLPVPPGHQPVRPHGPRLRRVLSTGRGSLTMREPR